MSTEFSTTFGDLGPESGSSVRRATVFDVRRFVTLRAPLIIVVAAALCVPSAILAWFLTPIAHTATAELHFMSLAPTVIDTGRVAPGPSFEKYLNTQLSLITGDTIISRVLDEAAVRELPVLAQSADPKAFLRKRIEARVEGRGELVTVSCTMSDREDARQILEELIRVYMNYMRSEEASAGGERLRILMKERDARQLELDAQLNQIKELQGALGIWGDSGVPAESTEPELYREKLVGAEEELAKAESAVAELERQIAEVEELRNQLNASPGKQIFALGIEERVGADPGVLALRQDLARAEAEVTSESEYLQDSAPKMKVLRNRVASMKASVASRESAVRGEVLNTILAQYSSRLELAKRTAEEAKAPVAKFKTMLEEYEKEYNRRVASTAEQIAALEQLRSKVAETTDQLASVRAEIRRIGLESNAPARVKIASSATVPASPGHRKKLMAVALALIISCGMGFSVGLAREITDQQIRTPQDIWRVTQLPVIAAVPHASEDTGLGAEMPSLVTVEYPHSTIADEFRRVLAWVLYPEENSAEVNSLLVASPTIGDGKTSLACNLAVALHQANRRVLLVDLCSQRPGVEKAFGLRQDIGLSEILAGDCTLDQAIRASGFENLGILGPGLNPHELAGRMASREMMELLEWANEEFDHTIIDTPPLLLRSNAKLLAPVMDGVILVVGAGVSTLGMVQRSLRGLEQLHANVLGVALNSIRRIRGGYMRHNLELYYAYCGEQAGANLDIDLPEVEILDEDEEGAETIELLRYAEAEEDNGSPDGRG